MFNRLAVTYESAQTRKYQLGRTEVIRSASNEVKEWVESMRREGETVSYIQFFSLICAFGSVGTKLMRMT